MESLTPLTISNSIGKAPSQLLTQNRKKYLLFKPIDEVLILNYNISALLFKHFKIRHQPVANFTFKGKKYFCIESVDSSFDFNNWYHYLWSKKRTFNQFLNPTEYFKVQLLNMLFPIFNKTIGTIAINDRKYMLFASFASFLDNEKISFNPINFTDLSLYEPEMKRFLVYQKPSLKDVKEAFEILIHDKFINDLKYTISLNSNLRNHYWNEVKECIEKHHQQYVFAKVDELLIRL